MHSSSLTLCQAKFRKQKNDHVITPHKQSVGYIKTKRQTLRKKIFNKQKQIIRKKFSKRRNAVSESETTAIHELHNLKDSKNNHHQTDIQLYFTDSEITSSASVKGKQKIKDCYTNKSIRLYN